MRIARLWWIGLLVGVVGFARIAAAADGVPSGSEVRVLFPFDESLDGWVLGGVHPSFAARISTAPGTWRDGGGAAEIRYQAGEKVLFGTDRFNQGPAPSLLQRVFGGEPKAQGPLIDVSSMRGVAFELWSEKGTTMFLIAGERDGARYVHPFPVKAGDWTEVRAPLAAFTLSEDSKDENGTLDPDQVYSVVLGDLRSFAGGDSEANRAYVDSFGILAGPGAGSAGTGPAVAKKPGDASASAANVRVRGPGNLPVARPGDELVWERSGDGELRFTDVETGESLSAATAPRRTGLYRVGASTLAVVPPGDPKGWLGTCVVSDLVSVEHAGADARLARAAGIAWDRPIVSWRGVEPERGAARWDQTDRLIEERLGQGFRVAPMVAHAPEWAGSDSSGDAPPEDLEALASFAERLVGRYRGRVHYWTIGNEPNWAKTKMAADTYVKLLAAFTRGAHRGDPQAKVLIAGLAFIDLDYVEKLYAAGAREHFDIMNVHPYAFPAPPEAEEGSDLLRRTVRVEASLAGIRKVRAVMEKHGDGAKPLWITEIAWGSGQAASDLEGKFRPFQVDPPTQARYYVRGALLARLWGADTFFLLAVPDLPDAAAQLFARSGVVQHDGAPKPALVALSVLAHEIGDARLVGEVKDLPPGAWGVEFESDAERIYALWAPTGKPSASLALPAGHARLIDFYGRELPLGELQEGRATVPLDDAPRYLHLPK